MKSLVDQLRKQSNFDTKSHKTIDRTLNRILYDFCKIFGVILGGCWNHFGVHTLFKIRVFFRVFLVNYAARRGRDVGAPRVRRWRDGYEKMVKTGS